MAKEDNLIHFDSERGKEMQKKSVEARYENKIKSLPHYNAFDQFYSIWNFVKHITITVGLKVL